MLKQKRFHFVGIGGAGMSALALLLLRAGKEVSGSDLEMNSYAKRVEKEGAKVFLGHRPANLGDAQMLVFSSAISPTNPEIRLAKERNILIRHRGQLLADLIKNKTSIAVSGMHGKTSVANMLAAILIEAHFQPSVALGGESFDLEGNARLGESPYFIAEADESDGSFLQLAPTYAVITNIEPEHLNFYKSEQEIISAFEQFSKRVKQAIFYNGEDRNIKRALQKLDSSKKVNFGFSPENDIFAENIEENDLTTCFDCFFKREKLGRIEIPLLGRCNVANCLAAIAVCLHLDVDFKKLKESFKDYKGVARRGEIKRKDKILIIEDYAHHPTEIAAVISSYLSIKKNNGGKIISIFQPHRYTRTKFLSKNFGRCFDKSDIVILSDIYPASEEPIPGISSELILEAINEKEGPPTVLLPKNEIVDYLKGIVRGGDIVLILGAGDIGELSGELARMEVE